MVVVVVVLVAVELVRVVGGAPENTEASSMVKFEPAKPWSRSAVFSAACRDAALAAWSAAKARGKSSRPLSEGIWIPYSNLGEAACNLRASLSWSGQSRSSTKEASTSARDAMPWASASRSSGSRASPPVAMHSASCASPKMYPNPSAKVMVLVAVVKVSVVVLVRVHVLVTLV